MKEWRIGCSGFYNRIWKGSFYPEDVPMKRWFEYYTEKFNSLELNTTFYSFPTAERLQGWHDRSPDDYSFSVKAPRLITHYKKFKDCKRLLNDFYTACEKGMKKKLGCLLFQMPPNFKYSEEHLELIIENLHPDFNNVVEFRDKQWWSEKVYNRLAEEKIIFCSISYPNLPEDIIINSEIAYVRYHGRPQLYVSDYTEKEIKELYEAINKKRKIKQAYVYFDNTGSNAGYENGHELQALVEK
jgi:uncharacterized protein YecE (DUF72 family)